MHTASYEFLMKPKISAEYHQTLSSWVKPGHKTTSKQANEHMHACVECSPMSVGLAQAHPNNIETWVVHNKL